MSQKRFKDTFKATVNKHGLTHRCTVDLLRLFQDALPVTASLPTHNSLYVEANEVRSDNILIYVEDPKCEFVILKVRDQLERIVTANWDALCVYQGQRHMPSNTICDCPYPDNAIGLLMNIDGGQLTRDSSVSMWPILLTVSNLPPPMRCKLKNVVLAGIWRGRGKPDWVAYLQHFIPQLSQMITVHTGNGTTHLQIKLQFLIADMPAKASLLNMKQFNGKYGCTLCYHKGVHWNHRHIYPSKEFTLRTNHQYRRHVEQVEQRGKPVKGIKGPSSLSSILAIPSDVVFDYMHQVLLGVTRSMVFTWIASKKIRVEVLDNAVKIRVPHDVTRKPRTLSLASVWKAQEWKRFLLYTGKNSERCWQINSRLNTTGAKKDAF
jgi:hypothetical protein